MEEKIRIGVSVVLLNQDNKVLIAKRNGCSVGNGEWHYPGGKLEYEDVSLSTAGKREVKEETGLDCQILAPDQIREDLFTIHCNFYGSPYIGIYLLGICRTEDNMPIPSKDNKSGQWRWVTPYELITYESENICRSWLYSDKVIQYFRKIKFQEI